MSTVDINSRIHSRLARQRLEAKLAKLKAEEGECGEELTREEQLAAKVMAALERVGVSATRVQSVLTAAAEGEELDPDLIPEEDEPITELEIEAGCRAILAELGIEIEEDGEESELEGSDDEELLDQISELTARLVRAAGSNPKRMFRAASRLTASLNLALVAAGKQDL